MLLLLILLSVLSVSLTWLWLAKIDQDFLLKQQEIHQQDKQQYSLLNDMVKNRMQAWLESFVHQQDKQPDQLASIKKGLESEFDFLQLHWQVNNLWLFDANKVALFSSSDVIPTYVIDDLEQILISQDIRVEVRCYDECEQRLTSPVLTNRGELAIISVSSSLMEILAFLNQSTNAQVAQVSLLSDPELMQASQLSIRGPIAKSKRQLIESLIQNIPTNLSFSQLQKYGARIHSDQRDFLLNLVPLQSQGKGLDYILLAHDITTQTLAYVAYQRRVVWTGIIIFCLSGALFFWFTSHFRTRLIKLSSHLPLLAQRRYQDFYHLSEQTQKTWFKDEVDLLQESAFELANQLDDLDKQIQRRTEELEKIAMYDALTGLPNRNMLNFELKRALAGLARKKQLVALLFLDLDDFKKVNDSQGHSIGDILLQKAAQRLLSVTRKTDLACRFGGDEFVILLTQGPELSNVKLVAEKLLDSFRSPIIVNKSSFYVSTSVGIAVAENADVSVDDLVRQADIAMYEAKTAGGSCFRVFDSEMFQKIWNKVALESEARDALSHQNFGLALQPQVETASGKLIGFEALLRWHHPTRGLIPPNDFIPILEGSEFMLSIGYWVIQHSFELLAEFKAWGYPELKIAVNLSAPQLLDPLLIPFLQQQVASSGLAAQLIEIELTERTLAEDIDNVMTIMHTLTELGFSISIDDFGTGYSSLSYLKMMPVDIIKIDGSFIQGMLNSQADRQIVISTISMVKKLGMKLVAEGIEELGQLNLLNQFDCDIAQGYFIAKPIHEKHLKLVLQDSYKNGIWLNHGIAEQIDYDMAKHSSSNQSYS